MALHLNLYHEVQKQHVARRRDPVKIGILVMLVAAFGLVTFYLVRLQQSSSIDAQLSALQSEWQHLDPLQKAAAAREAELNNAIQTSDKLLAQIEGRFYWAPILERIQAVVPAEVQITHLDGRPADDKSGDVKIQLDGVAAGTEPRTVAEELRTALTQKFASNYKGATAIFRTLDDGTATVKTAGNIWPTANFGLNFTIKTAAAAPVAPVVHRERRKIKE